MECCLYEILISMCAGNDNYTRFFEAHKKDIRFKSFDGHELEYEVSNVGLIVDTEKSIRRIANIKVGVV